MANNFTNGEYVDMMQVFFECQKKFAAVRRMYHQSHPNRPIPLRQIFSILERRLRETRRGLGVLNLLNTRKMLRRKNSVRKRKKFKTFLLLLKFLYFYCYMYFSNFFFYSTLLMLLFLFHLYVPSPYLPDLTFLCFVYFTL